MPDGLPDRLHSRRCDEIAKAVAWEGHTLAEVVALLSHLDDGAAPNEIHDDGLHAFLVGRGLVLQRVEPDPDPEYIRLVYSISTVGRDFLERERRRCKDPRHDAACTGDTCTGCPSCGFCAAAWGEQEGSEAAS